MSLPQTCPKCGAQLPADAPESLCPACLMSKALASHDAATMKFSGAGSAAKSAALPSVFPFEFGGYHVLGLLGRGGMGAAYEAMQVATGRRVALKVLGHGMDSEEMRKRFLREGRLAAAVSHPNSIYIFGTEEIEGAPVIVMEIAGGGTLKDELKKRGPLPVRDAVDAMLQIIAGLEAAHAGGVLHRDVKPANCFVSPDGTVKVGDFGLSVSTLARTDTQLTASGMMLGTPSFAPPEQLRGDELDLRADIYSVGATLYTLLTGRAPFEGENAVQVVAAVLDKVPKPVTEFRKDVPSGLAQVITRCMAKRREARFANYAALRDALLPFSSQVPQPAPFGLRFLAGLMDEFINALPGILLGFLIVRDFDAEWLSQRTFASFVPSLTTALLYIGYYAVPEGLWGASIGKALCGLRVIGPAQAAPGILRASVRALVFWFALNIGTVLALLATSAAQYAELAKVDATPGHWWFWMFFVAWLGLFVTMRRSNGFAAIHDFVSGTRVVLRQKSKPRPKLASPGTAANQSPQSMQPAGLPALPRSIGPFAIVNRISDRWLEGNDAKLRRSVWIRLQDKNAAPVSDARREVARATRPRWIGGARDAAGNWDAFESPSGQPLLSLNEASQPWEMVRHWLADLADEINAGGKDSSLPANVSLGNVWITTDGRAVLLDDPVAKLDLPIAAQDDARFMLADAAGSQAFLSAVAARVLDPRTVPLHARDVLQKLAIAAFDRMSFAAGNLQSLLTKPGTISCGRRALSLLLVPAMLVGAAMLIFFGTRSNEGDADAAWKKLHPDLPPLSAVLRLRDDSDPYARLKLAWMPDSDLHHLQIPVYIAAHYRESLGAAVMKKQDDDPATPLDDEERVFVRGCFTGFPSGHANLSPDAIARADARVKEALVKHEALERHASYFYGLNALKNILLVIAIVQLLTIIIFGTTPGQRVFGIAILNKKGAPVGRLHMLGRWFISWMPLILTILRPEIQGFTGRPLSTSDLIQMWGWGAVFVLGVIAAIARPVKGVQDDQAKTWLVPR